MLDNPVSISLSNKLPHRLHALNTNFGQFFKFLNFFKVPNYSGLVFANKCKQVTANMKLTGYNDVLHMLLFVRLLIGLLFFVAVDDDVVVFVVVY